MIKSIISKVKSVEKRNIYGVCLFSGGIIGLVYNEEIKNNINEKILHKKKEFNEERMRELIKTYNNDPVFQKEVKDVLLKIMMDEEIQNQINKLLQNSINEVITNEKTKEETSKFIRDIMWKSIKLW